MRCCDLRIILLVFVLLTGCDKNSNSQKLASQLPSVSIQTAEDDAESLTYHWDHHGKDTACLLPIPNLTSKPVTMRFRQAKIDGSLVGVLFLESEYAIEVGKILSDQTMIFVRPGEVIPYHDQLYRVTFDDDSLDLKRVTQFIPESFRPNPGHLVIPLTEHPAIRRRLFHLQRDDWSDYERVRVIHIAEDASHAKYQGKPYYDSAQGVLEDNTIEPNEVVHRWAQSTTDVAAIVPPVEIEGVGKLRGWVAFRQTLADN
ncbi:hypothetical protein Pan97_52740 [Bremerella volcania]|uniref:Uncharacterized protein n=1 Tax=Bremerella volcania TaxID=2527984 RepID=A0A518CG44_9BACT|nr:hypothetical protein [Bremerella volcania]QDU78191.1 hypothetical protein Pan97_52740 [Bremerella volcania]